jgi:hypothetical protein
MEDEIMTARIMRERSNDESGAALVMVIVATLLLGTACIALLSAVGASSRNNTDALSESKAYWAAESGLQATINVLRFKNVTYSTAVANPTLNSATVTGGLVYTGSDVVVNGEAKYRISVSNPDAARPYTFFTTGSFQPAFVAPGAVADNNVPKVCIPTCEADPRTEVTFTGVTSTNVDFVTVPKPNPSLGSYTVTRVNGGAQITKAITFKVEFKMTSPIVDSRTIRGSIAANTSAADPVILNFDTMAYTLQGSDIELCRESDTTSPGAAPNGNCPNFNLSFSTLDTSKSFRADISRTEPYRILVKSRGFGPNGSEKQLEAILQRSFFNGYAGNAAISLIGPNPTLGAGTGAPTYCGRDGGYTPDNPPPNTPPCTPDPNMPSGPSVGITDPDALDDVLAGSTGATMTPAPDVLTDLPLWQSSPAEMDAFIQYHRAEAQNTGRYIASTGNMKTISTNGNNAFGIGNHSTGTGLTFCEGDCQVTGSPSGGGILIVTGRFEYSGGMSFNGLIVVIGPMHRDGAGGGQIIGNIVIAPYDPLNLNAGFSSPSFTTGNNGTGSGGGNADIVFGSTSEAYNGASAVTNFMVGIAEK